MSNNPESQICKLCGSKDTKLSTQSRIFEIPFGKNLEISNKVIECSNCGDSYSVSPEVEIAKNPAYQKEVVASINNMLSYILGLGFQMAYIERTLGLPPRTLIRWKNEGCSASGLALLRLMRACPWLLKIADEKYRSLETDKEVIFQSSLAINKYREIDASRSRYILNGTVMDIPSKVEKKDPIIIGEYIGVGNRINFAWGGAHEAN